MKRKKSSGGRVREPIQVYLDQRERSQLDRLAHELGLSRAEVLRRGLMSLADRDAGSLFQAMEALVGGFSSKDAPADLAEAHDERLAQDHDERTARFLRRSS